MAEIGKLPEKSPRMIRTVKAVAQGLFLMRRINTRKMRKIEHEGILQDDCLAQKIKVQ